MQNAFLVAKELVLGKARGQNLAPDDALAGSSGLLHPRQSLASAFSRLTPPHLLLHRLSFVSKY
jgi:hypothetical protein